MSKASANVSGYDTTPPPRNEQEATQLRSPLTTEEEARARANWNQMRRDMPRLAEFVAVLAEDPKFDGRRVLADAKLRRFSDGEAPPEG